MRILFMGSAEFSCPSLVKLMAEEGMDVAAVVSQPDRPKGRNLAVQPCAVKALASDGELSIFTPDDINTPESLNVINKFAPELVVAVAYGQILGKDLLAMPRLGCVNLHASLLPKYRGAAPIQWAIANGEKVTGVSTIFMNEKMDEGDIILQRPVEIGPEDTAGTMHDVLARVGAELLLETVRLVGRGSAPRTPQDETSATYAPKLKKQEGRIDWTKPAETIYNKVRGFNPWPVCRCTLREAEGVPAQTLRLLECRVEAGSGRPGEIIDIGREGPLAAAGAGAIRLVEIQPEGGRVMTGAEFLRGHKIGTGLFLE